MHIKFPSRVEQAMSYAKKRFLPRSLFFRTMLLIFVPLIVVQVVSVYAYWNSSWNKVGRKLSDNLAQDMAFIIQADDGTKDFAQIQAMAEKIYDMKVQYISIMFGETTRKTTVLLPVLCLIHSENIFRMQIPICLFQITMMT